MDLATQLKTKRLILRPLTFADAELMQEALDESWDELAKWLPWATGQDLEETRTFINQRADAFTRDIDYAFGIFHKDLNKFLGCIDIRSEDARVPSFECGYWMRTSATGKGYAGEALTAITRFGFEQLGANRISVCGDAKHKKSERVMLAAGFVKEAVLKNFEPAVTGEGLRDTLVYAHTPESWQAFNNGKN